MTMRDHVERYVTLRRHLGYKFVRSGRLLQSYANHAMAHCGRFSKAADMIEWASKASSPTAMCRRLNTVRRFAVWLHAEDDRHEIPARDALGRQTRQRPLPHLLTDSDVRRLMEAALSLPPAGSITPLTYHYAIGLMAATGLRRSETSALRLTDLTPDGLIVNQTKFGKRRLVALHESARHALGQYLAVRTRAGGCDDHLFVLSNGRPPSPASLTRVFIQLARQTGLRGGPGEPGPRLHDLRHSFAVKSLEAAVATDRDSVNRHMLALATYLGHVSLASTHWYLEATPLLLRQVARETERAYARRVSQ